MKKLRLDDLHVESFTTTTSPEKPGTVHAHDDALTQDCTRYNDPSCNYGSCQPTVCGSCTEPTCDVTCGPPNYGCDSVDPRCTHGGVYPC